MNDKRLLQLETLPDRKRWMPRGGDGSVWPWPCLVPHAHHMRFYQQMIEEMKRKSPIAPFRKVLDIGQDRGESMMWISTISEKVIGIDIDTRMIEVSQANLRMSGRYDQHRHSWFVLPEKSLVDVDEPRWRDIDLVKIDAGARTLFVLEALAEVLERNHPVLFVIHDDSVNNEQIWDYLIKRHGYMADVLEPNRCPNLGPGMVMMGYAHPKGKNYENRV